MRKTLYASLLGTALLLGACAEQEAERPMLSDRPIAFSASIADDWNQTRSGSTISAATQTVTSDFRQPLYVHAVTTAGFEGDGTTTRGTKVTSLSEFSVSGYCYDAAGSQTVSDVQANFLNDDQITQGEGGLWLSSQPFYWPLAGYALDFYAYSPTTAATAVQDTQGPLKLTYSVNTTDIEAQTDLLTAKATGETFSKNATVSLEFHHALTAVQFVIGDNTVPGTLKSVKFEEVYTSGTLNTGTDQWTLSAAPDYAISFTDHSTSDEDLLTGTKTLLMIPQTFTSENQRIVVVVNDGVQDYTLAWNLKDSRWEANTTVIYRISTSELNVMQMGTVTFPTTWGTGDNTVTYPFKSAYEENDAIGVFAVDGAGKVINANVKYKYDGTAWVKDDTQTTFYPATYTFYAYYPYQADGLSGAPAVGTNVLTEGALPTVSQFFSAARTAWAPAATQNTDALINAQDLQYAQGTITDGTNVNFTMAHACELVAVELKTTTVPNRRYYLSSDANYTWNHDNNTTAVTASSTFDSWTPRLSSGKYYYIVQGAKTLAATGDDSWSWAVNGTENTYEAKAVKGVRGDQNGLVVTRWTLAVGDVFYSDGAISKTGSMFSARTPIGLVFATSTSATDSGHNWTHGYVLALKDASTSSMIWGIAGTNPTGRYISKTSNPSLINNKDGYTETQSIKTAGGTSFQANYPAAYYATRYSTALPSGKTSGWYLPSSGQWYDILYYLGGLQANGRPAYTYYDAFYVRWWKNDMNGQYSNCTTEFTTHINNLLNTVKNGNSNAVVGSIQTTGGEFYGGSGAAYWASTEYSTNSCYMATLFIEDNLGVDGRFGGQNYRDGKKMYVRSVLAF